MKLATLNATRFRSLKRVTLEIQPLNLLIGPNASGKSNVLDALRFLSEGVAENGFADAVAARGNLRHLAWKGERSREILLKTEFEDQDIKYTWSVALRDRRGGFGVEERIDEKQPDTARRTLLESRNGEGWWWSSDAAKEVTLSLGRDTGCALSAAAADASFPARELSKFVENWRFFDPNPGLLRRASPVSAMHQLAPSGRNLAARLNDLRVSRPPTFERILSATRSILGVPTRLEFRDNDGLVHFVQSEPGLEYPVHQIGASSGTLRMLALMTALYGEEEAGLVGIEEPENYVHPSALSSFAEHLLLASKDKQIAVTTHSPLLLDCIGVPEAVCVVTRSENGSRIERNTNPDDTHKALEESGFGLGEFYETKGFGA